MEPQPSLCICSLCNLQIWGHSLGMTPYDSSSKLYIAWLQEKTAKICDSLPHAGAYGNYCHPLLMTLGFENQIRRHRNMA